MLNNIIEVYPFYLADNQKKLEELDTEFTTSHRHLLESAVDNQTDQNKPATAKQINVKENNPRFEIVARNWATFNVQLPPVLLFKISSGHLIFPRDERKYARL